MHAQTVSIMGPNLRGATETFHVHAAGCADLKRRNVYAGHDPFTMEARTVVEIVDDFYPLDEFDCTSGEYLHDFKVFPCVTIPMGD